MPSFIPSKRFAKKYQGSGGGGSPPPESTTNGVLDKTPYSYLSRDGSTNTVTGIDYSQDWAVEVAVDIPRGSFSGYYNEICRHAQAKIGFAFNRPGWSLGYAQGYNETSFDGGIQFVVNGSSSTRLVQYTTISGKTHFIASYKASTKTLSLFTNGIAATPVTDAGFLPVATHSYALGIGTFDDADSGYTPTSEYAFATDPKVATAEFKMYLMRIWQKELVQSDATNLYNHWNSTGQTSIPGTVTGVPVTEYNFKEQVGDAGGGAGTGWIKDVRGGNHLKIVSTNAATGATGPTSTTKAPSGSVRISNISNGATGVSGGITIEADGLSGTGNYMQYYIEVDTDNTFTSPDLKQSGWLLCDGKWRPALNPSTAYFARVKARNGDTLSESSWSSSIVFSTRAVAEYFCRPLSWSKTKVYGNQDGSSYANAWNGLRYNGGQGGLPAIMLETHADGRNIAPGDTIWHCGEYFNPSQSDWGIAQSISPWYQYLVGEGNSAYPIKLRFDHVTYPGALYNMNQVTGDWEWVSEGSGVYSSTHVVSDCVNILFDETNSGKPTVGNSIQDKSYPRGSAGPLTSAGWYYDGSKIYVKRPDNANPGNSIWLNRGYCSFTPIGRYLQIQGGGFYGVTFNNGKSTNITVTGITAKYRIGFMFQFQKFIDDWIVEDCDISRTGAGIYGVNEGISNCGNRNIIRRNWIHHIGMGQYSDGDSHCIGIQAGIDWIVEDNLCEYSGPCIEQWNDSSAFSQIATGLICRRNVIRKPSNRNDGSSGNPFAAGIVLSGGGSPLGYRTGQQFLHNVIFDCEGSNFHDSNADLHEVKYNLMIKSGTAPQDSAYTKNWAGNGSASRPQNVDFQYNVCIDPNTRFISGGGSGVSQTVTINNNLYWDPIDTSATSNKFYYPGIGGGGTYSFTDWKALGTVDQNSFFEDPLTTSHLPTGFDSLMIQTFCRPVLGDVDGDGDVDSNDLTVFDAAPAGNGARIAARKLITNLIAYGNY